MDDITSLQTGPNTGGIDNLGWATLRTDVTRPGGGDMANAAINWKGNEVYNDTVLYPAGPGQLVFGGRTGGANAAHHIDNIWIIPEPGSLALVLTGMGFASFWKRRRRRAKLSRLPASDN